MTTELLTDELQLNEAIELAEWVPLAPEGSPAIGAARFTLRTDTLADSVVILLVMAVVQRLVGFGRSLLVCGWLEPEQLGQWDLANRFLIFAAPLAMLGLPGTFGRYLEYYRLQGSLRTVLVRTIVVCSLLTGVAVFAMLAAPEFVSEQVFGTAANASSVPLLAFALVSVIAYNFLSEMLTALRLVRIGATFQFINSVAFALFCVALLAWWQTDATAIVAAYGASCLLLVVVALLWTARAWPHLPHDASAVSHRELWPKLLRFASWIWITNILTNLYEIAGRYLLIHYGNLADPQAAIGQYHSAQIIPVLIVSVAVVLSGMILPHLTSDWEQGRRKQVDSKMNLTIKLLGLAMLAGSTVVLLIAPLLFNVVLRGKYSEGIELLPLVLTGCAWAGLMTVAHTYLWCAELAARLGSLALLIGLVGCVVLNLILIPTYGLTGTVVAATLANLIVLVAVLVLNWRLGMEIHRGVLVICLLPIVLLLGTPMACVVTIAATIYAIFGSHLFNTDEKQQIAAVAQNYYRRIARR